ncbi:TonB-linked SusC/RagA family outer membrane protein [Dyadobacter jejuensis]|uniref:TonB-linked SusC/RagA family outer membrane protein n=1 Tax=Dyadobacter jejuensis TaxID=1082580 RepID=A0A316ALM0_9BACT|nr:TonB-dependent receptor [Dyadobacter jejuensis]PWJ57954.1 TonB-linked SusC/RagA family outer membrane protein [Dyadobacter jejuensis]
MKLLQLKTFSFWAFAFCLCLLASGEKVNAQQIIKGKVTSAEDQQPLPGANIKVKDTTIGVVTDVDGNFTLDAPEDSKILVISYIGFAAKEESINGRSIINIALDNDQKSLEEVVVIGFGTTSKKKMTGAISTMDAKKLEQTPFPNVGQALQGQVAGLVIQNNGGGPGSKPSVSIRGGGAPLYVIDGVVTSVEDFNALNPNDVQSISFLKDASATAVYGSKAGNGIVLVNTKKGESGKINVNYSYNHQISQPTVLPKMLNSYDYALIQNQASAYDGTVPTYTPEQLEIIRTHSDLEAYPDNNWPDLALKKFANESKHNLSIRGGDQRTNYFVSLGYMDQGGILKADVVDFSRFNLRSNITSHVEKLGLEFGINVNASLERYREPSAGMWSIWQVITNNTPPNYRAFNTDGTLAGGAAGDHPLAISNEDAGYKKDRDKFLNSQAYIKWHVPSVDGLSFGVMANYRDGDGWSRTWNHNAPQYLSDGTLMKANPPTMSVSSYYTNRLYYESSVSYAKTFGKHGIDATAVYTQTTTNGETLQASRRNYLSSAVDQLFAGPAEGKDNDGNQTKGAIAGYVGRLKYDYAGKYIIEFSGRYDGNDNFAPAKRWGFFPAVSVGWNVADEGFMEPLISKNIINDLKLRVSYGKTGISDGVQRFGYIPVYNLEANAYNIGNSLVTGFSEGNLVNPNELTWYTRNSLNYGVDFASLGNKLTGSFDYFYYRTTGYLVSPKDRYTTPLGKNLPQIASNSAQRRAGFDMVLRYKNNIGKLQYEIGGNVSYFNQLWEQLDTENEATLKNPYTRQTHRTDYWAGGSVYVSDGLYQNGAEILNAPRLLASTETQAGDIKYTDINGDGKIDAQDQRRVGLPSMPHTNFGVDFNLRYQGWSMSGLVQGTGSRYIGFHNWIVAGEARKYVYEYQQNFWSPQNPNGEFSRPSHTSAVNGGNNVVDSDYYLKNARYLRLKNFQIGYDLKYSLLKNVKFLSTCRMYINGTNLLTASGIKKYFDPEQSELAGAGEQSYGYPVQRTYSLGVNVAF